MKIWYDAGTGKQVRYAVAIARRLRSLGHEVTLTTRKHPDTLPLAEFLEEEFIVAGRYNPRSLMTRLKESIRRQRFFCKIFRPRRSGRCHLAWLRGPMQSSIWFRSPNNLNGRHSLCRGCAQTYANLVRLHHCLKGNSKKNLANLQHWGTNKKF